MYEEGDGYKKSWENHFIFVFVLEWWYIFSNKVVRLDDVCDDEGYCGLMRLERKHIKILRLLR